MTTRAIADLVPNLEETSNIIYNVMNLVRAVNLIKGERCKSVNDEIVISLLSHISDILETLNKQAQETLSMAVEIREGIDGDRA